MTAFNLRFEGARFANGAFTAPENATRDDALRIAAEAVDMAARFGAGRVILWMADDGWDYPFQANYSSLWDAETDGFRVVTDRNPSVHVSVEYKPQDPRRFSLIRSMGDALLAVRDVDRPNFGVTLDVRRGYMAGEIRRRRPRPRLARASSSAFT